MKFLKIVVPVFLLSSATVASASDVTADIEDHGPLDHANPGAAAPTNNEKGATTSSLRGGALRGNRRLQGRMSDDSNFTYRGTDNYCGFLSHFVTKDDHGWVRMVCKDDAEMNNGQTIKDKCEATCYVATSLGENNDLVFGWRGNYCGYLRDRLNNGEKQEVSWACLERKYHYTGDGEVGDHCAFTCYAAGWKPTSWRPDLTLPVNWFG